MSFQISNNTVKVNLSTTSSILGMKRAIEFNANNIVKFSVSNRPPKSNGFRILGIYIPYLIKVGMFYSPLIGDWEYWDVSYVSSGFYCEFLLKNESYRRILIKTDDTQIIEQMKSLEKSKS